MNAWKTYATQLEGWYAVMDRTPSKHAKRRCQEYINRLNDRMILFGTTA